MAMALSLGRRGLGRTWPNPAVGCVIVKDGRVVGRGWTAAGGRPHAEPQALAQAGADAIGATVYVTLEPCSHVGQTPPCAQTLIDAQVGHVVAALADHDSRVDGCGFDMLRAAGIPVTTGVLAERSAQDHRGFFLRCDEGRPMLCLKLASSFDGRIATATGDSQWITDAPARRLVHLMRATHDAVLIGGGTARDDDPSLTVRDLGIDHHPVRVVASRNLDLPMSGKLAQTAAQTPLWLCHGPRVSEDLKSAWLGLGAILIECRETAQGLDMRSVMDALGEKGITRVFCEGGGTLAASLLQADVVDELIGFSAGVVIGSEGRSSIGPLGLTRLASAQRFTLAQTRPIGPDVLHVWNRAP